jgi:hypothetical protein
MLLQAILNQSCKQVDAQCQNNGIEHLVAGFPSKVNLSESL